MTKLNSIFLLLLSMFLNSPADAQNQIQNPGFENGLDRWTTWGAAKLEQTDEQQHSGLYSARVSNRTETWQGAVHTLNGQLLNGTSYKISAWVRVSGDIEQPISFTFAQTDDRGEDYIGVVNSTAFHDRWVQYSDVFTYVSDNGPVSRLDFYIHGPPPGVNLFVDDVEILPLSNDWQDDSDQGIDLYRKRDVRVTVKDSQGHPVAGAMVELKQTARAFPMGTVMSFEPFDTEPEYREYIVNHFNWAVHENEAKWYGNEWSRGNVTYEKADAMLDFADANDIRMRGHNIFWAPEEWQPAWVPDLPDDELALEVDDRLEDAVAHFKGRFRHWDVNNEMLHGDFFERRLGGDIRKWMFDRSREIDPDVALFVNDFNVISGVDTDAYVQQIQGFLDQGFPLDGIGVQGHFTNADYWAIQVRLDKLAQFGLPIWVTELDVLQEDENIRADTLELVLRSAFAHPDVEGILLWGFWAGAHWKGPDAALVDLDWTVNAAGQRFDDLLIEWTSNEATTTNSSGVASARVFHGSYDLEISLPNRPLTRLTTQVDPSGAELKVDVNLDYEVEPDFAINAGLSGAWYNPDTSGQGLFIDVDAASKFIFLSWFTYTDAGSGHPFEQRWFTAQGNYDGNTAVLALYESLGGQFNDAQAVMTRQIGTVTLNFDDCGNGLLAYHLVDESLDGEFSVVPVIPAAANRCSMLSGAATEAVDINFGMNGAWYDPGTSGQGLLFDAQPGPDGGNFFFASWFTYGDDTASGQRWFTAQGSFQGSVTELDVYETTGGSFDDPQATGTAKVGSMSIGFTDCSHAQLNYSLPGDGAEGEIILQRLLSGSKVLCEDLL